jgi:type I restriction enzyme S subunit
MKAKKVPSNWDQKQLCEVTDLITCGVAKRPEYFEIGIPFLSAKNVKNGEVIWNDYKFVSPKTHQELTKNNKPQKGDILYTRVGSFGEAAIIEEDREFSIFVSLTLIKTKPIILNTFVKYYLNSSEVKNFAKNNVSGSGVGNLNVGTVRKFVVPVPPLEEQKRIVNILDESFEAIAIAEANTKKNLANARELFDSYLNKVFTEKGDRWVQKTFDEVCMKIQDGAHHSPKKTYSEKQEGFFTYITSRNIRNNYMDFKKIEYVEKDFHDSIYTRCKPELGDILLTKDGVNTGNVTLNTLDKPFSLLSSVCLIKTKKEKILPAFLKFYIQSPHGFKQITGEMTGAAIKRIILKKIKSAIVPLPDIEEQKKIIEQLDYVLENKEKLEGIYQRKLEALAELKQSILQKAFTGQLTQ